MSKNKRFFLAVIFLLFIVIYSNGQENSEGVPVFKFEESQEFNNPSTFNKTALLFLEEAKNQLILNNWDIAYSMAENALVYDSSIADLYYIQAISLFEKGELYYTIVPLLEKSLTQSETIWYNFNKDSARVLLARLYVHIKRPQEALELLDEIPALYTADALYTRSAAYYVIGDTAMARKSVLDGANQHPLDFRFDELFYMHEYKYRLIEENSFIQDQDLDQSIDENVPVEQEDAIFEFNFPSVTNDENVLAVQAENDNEIEDSENSLAVSDELYFLTSFFNNRAQQFSKTNPSLMLYTAIFTDESDEKTRLLRAWQAQGEKHPLFAIHALKSGIMHESLAFEYMLDFFPNIRLSVLQEFVRLLKEKDVIEVAKDYFNSYEGNIAIDTDGDLQEELTILYERGRPEKIDYDENQDGKLSWSMTNDYGEPKNIMLYDDDMFIQYNTWPYASVVSDAHTTNASTVYYIVSETLSLPIIDFVEDEDIKSILSVSMYTPIVLEGVEVSQMDLFNASYIIDFPTTEYANSRGQYTLLDGIVKSALYTDNERPYAYTLFQNGIPMYRNVDRDNNGSYEVVEVYAQHNSQDEDIVSSKLLQEVFRFTHIAENQYVQKVYVDLNNDGFDDFSQEYITNEETISFWDSNNDGNWDVQYSQNTERNTQLVQYVHPLTGNIQSVELENNIPVLANGKPITLDENTMFYWIGESAGSAHATQIITELRLQSSTISLIVTDQLWNSNTEQFMRIVGIKNGDMYFGEIFYE